jgi:membrane fusion protein, multidrug efflux system
MLKHILLQMSVLLISVLLITSCGQKTSNEGQGNVKNDSTQTKTDSVSAAGESADRGNMDQDLIPVEVTTIALGEISDYILLNSNLETEIMADVSSRIQGIVFEIKKEEGQYVRKGEVLLTLEAREYEIAEQRARVEYDQQVNNFKRLEMMHEKNLLSDEELERAKFTLENSRLLWEEAKLNLDYTNIQSPINGKIGERLAKIGERIQPTNKLFSVVNTEEVIAVVYVPERNLNRLKIGQKAVIYSENIQGEQFDGWIKRISPVVDPSSGTFKVTIGVRNRSDLLRPGMFVNLQIITDTRENTVLIPKTAVVYENEFMNVYVVRDGVAHKIRLTPGFEDNVKVESLKDIEAGEKVIVVGQSGMRDKTKVKIVSEREILLSRKS